jgi:hypothetical protein
MDVVTPKEYQSYHMLKQAQSIPPYVYGISPDTSVHRSKHKQQSEGSFHKKTICDVTNIRFVNFDGKIEQYNVTI